MTIGRYGHRHKGSIAAPRGPPQMAHSQSNQCQIMGYLLNNQKGIIALDVKEAVRGEHYLSASSKN